MVKAGIFSWFSYTLPIEERLHLIKTAGFAATSLWWGEEDRYAQPDMARHSGLEIDNIHTPFTHPNDLWLDNQLGVDYLSMLMQCVEDCVQFNIPVAVVHITGFSKIVELSQLGMDRIKKLVEFAEDKGICLAFENLLYLQHLSAILDSNASSHLGLCYDSGHEHCSQHYADCLSKYGDRLFAVHLHDNLGDGDMHLLPYDGTVDWNGLKEKLQNSKPIAYFTLEVNFDSKYDKSHIYDGLSAEEYLSLAYQRALRLLPIG